jgi:hypothetical protein
MRSPHAAEIVAYILQQGDGGFVVIFVESGFN